MPVNGRAYKTYENIVYVKLNNENDTQHKLYILKSRSLSWLMSVHKSYVRDKLFCVVFFFFFFFLETVSCFVA
jgi:hypothetical protein